MLPGGRLREWSCFAKRADVMVVTKSPAAICPDEQRNIQHRYSRIFPHDIFFASIGYGEPLAVFPNGSSLSISDFSQYDVLLVTGIANPKPFETFISQYAASVQTITFPDHHAFSEKDITMIAGKWNNIISVNKILITTEKDAVRLQQMEIPEAIAPCIYCIPIEVNFMDDGQRFMIFVSGKYKSTTFINHANQELR